MSKPFVNPRSRNLASAEPITVDSTALYQDEELDLFSEAQALQNCLRFLQSSACDLGLEETVDTLALAVQAIDQDLRRYCN